MDYIKKPAYATRSELLEMRKKGRVPDQSYDLDGDGHVGQREMFMAARLDKVIFCSLSTRICNAKLLDTPRAVLFSSYRFSAHSLSVYILCLCVP